LFAHVRVLRLLPEYEIVAIYSQRKEAAMAAAMGSRDKPAQNADGSTDLYLGPKAPDGKAGNWLATVPGKGYFAILRLYGPTEPAINKSWKRSAHETDNRVR
jgi:hypothetical protein